MSEKDHRASLAADHPLASPSQSDAASHVAPKHTPGPWHVHPKMEGHVFAGDVLIAGCMGHSRNFNAEGLREEQSANAHLIAAAPEMYEALVETMRALRLLRDSYPAEWDALMAGHNAAHFLTAWDTNKAVIAKAEGR